MNHETRGELLRIAATLVRGLHKDVVFSKTTPWYVRHRVQKVIDDAENQARELGIKIKTALDKERAAATVSLPLETK